MIETAQSQARLIEAMARHDAIFEQGTPGGSEAATLSQVIDAHDNYAGFGETGEFTLARIEGEDIIFLLSHRHGDLEVPSPIAFDSELAEPMRQALLGRLGSLVGIDYRGVEVLAAYEPVAVLDLGIVAKIDMTEVGLIGKYRYYGSHDLEVVRDVLEYERLRCERATYRRVGGPDNLRFCRLCGAPLPHAIPEQVGRPREYCDDCESLRGAVRVRRWRQREHSLPSGA